MRFASPFPWWLAVVLVAVAAGAAYRAYARPIIPLSLRQRGVLMGLRFAAFLVLLLLLAQPVRLEPAAATDTLVPVLLDQSRSMAVADVDGGPRLDAAVARVMTAVGDGARSWTALGSGTVSEPQAAAKTSPVINRNLLTYFFARFNLKDTDAWPRYLSVGLASHQS